MCRKYQSSEVLKLENHASRAGVVNDLVQLKSKDTLALFDEFGPIRYNAPQRVGFTTRAELINGRIAMVAITAASALSISQGNFWDRVLDGALPFQFW